MTGDGKQQEARCTGPFSDARDCPVHAPDLRRASQPSDLRDQLRHCFRQATMAGPQGSAASSQDELQKLVMKWGRIEHDLREQEQMDQFESGKAWAFGRCANQLDAMLSGRFSEEYCIDRIMELWPSHASGEPGPSIAEIESFEAELDKRERLAYQRGQQAMAEKAAQHWPIGELGMLTDFRCSCGATLIGVTPDERIAAWQKHIRSLAGAEPQPSFVPNKENE